VQVRVAGGSEGIPELSATTRKAYGLQTASCIPSCIGGMVLGELSCLGSFSELRKATVSFVMCVRLSVWNNSATRWTDSRQKFGIWVFVENLSRKLKFY
jgi:hypothetical protein